MKILVGIVLILIVLWAIAYASALLTLYIINKYMNNRN